MTKHDPMVSMREMLEYARTAMEFAHGRIREDLDRDRMFRFALVRAVEVIGEAASRVPQEIRQSYHTIPWSQIVGVRNRLVHAYDQINLDILWEIVTVDLQPLAQALEAILPPFSE